MQRDIGARAPDQRKVGARNVGDRNLHRLTDATAPDDPNGCAGKVATSRGGNARRVAGDRGLSSRVARRVYHEDLVARDECDLEDQHQQPEHERQYERELDRCLSVVGTRA